MLGQYTAKPLWPAEQQGWRTQRRTVAPFDIRCAGYGGLSIAFLGRLLFGNV